MCKKHVQESFVGVGLYKNNIGVTAKSRSFSKNQDAPRLKFEPIFFWKKASCRWKKLQNLTDLPIEFEWKLHISHSLNSEMYYCTNVTEAVRLILNFHNFLGKPYWSYLSSIDNLILESCYILYYLFETHFLFFGTLRIEATTSTFPKYFSLKVS